MKGRLFRVRETEELPMIFRAMVRAYPKELPERAQDERVVFIEAANRDDALDRLPLLTATTWRVPVESVDIYDIEDEFELMASPFAEGLPREHAIFLIEWGHGQTTFLNWEIQRGHAMFFLAGELDSVMNAYKSLPRNSLGQ